VTTLATCWKLFLRSGQIQGFTDFDCNLTIDSLTYHGRSGFTPSSIVTAANLAVDHMEIEGVLDSEHITEQDLRVGRYDLAEVLVFMVNYMDITGEKIILQRGWIGEVRQEGQRYVAEIRSLSHKLNQSLGALYAPTCRAKFGDERCKMREADFSFASVITEVTNRRLFSIATVTKFQLNYGAVSFDTNMRFEIKSSNGVKITLMQNLPYDLQVGDKCWVLAGCDKSFKCCVEVYHNAVNFRGEPHLPGLDALHLVRA
jgi:uncharacterized phage protein (TIGR02218 family)